MKKRVLVTGGAGFIGSNFCNINKEKYDMVALDNLFLGDKENLDPEITFIQGDACNKNDLEKAGKVDCILHLAGTSSAPMFVDDFVGGYVNSVQSFVTTLQWAKENEVKKVLYASTSSLYANNPMPLIENQHVTPPNHYAVTKHLYEECSVCFNRLHPRMDIIGFRFMSVFGPNEEAKGKYANVISQFAWDIARGKAPIIFGDGEQYRDFTHVSDVVQGITLAMETEKKLGADVFNIGTGETTSLNTVVKLLNEAFEKPIEPEHIPNPVKELYIHGQHADISKISSVLGYKPKVKMVDGLRDQVKNLRMEKIRETSSDQIRNK